MKNAFLFVYGTLLDDDNEYAIYLKNNSSFYSEGRLRGKLYDIGEYPGVILSEETDTFVYGNILKIDRPQKVFAVVDGYEGYGTDQPRLNEFMRKLIEVETAAGVVTCWVYFYNLSTDGLFLFENGRYIK